MLCYAKSLQSCPTLCDPIDGSPPGSPVPGILQARTLEWAAISFSKAWKWKVKAKSFSRVRLLATPWTAAYQAPPSMGFSRQEWWSGVPLPSPLYPLGATLFEAEVEAPLFHPSCRWHCRSNNEPLLTALLSLAQLSISLGAMKAPFTLKAELALQWQDTTLICNFIKTFLTNS